MAVKPRWSLPQGVSIPVQYPDHTAVARAVLERRRIEVIEIVAAGHSFDDVAQLLGYANRSRPYPLVSRKPWCYSSQK